MHRRGYTAVVKLGQKPAIAQPLKQSEMSRPTILVILVLLIVGALVLLSTLAKEVPTTTIESDVTQAPDAR